MNTMKFQTSPTNDPNTLKANGFTLIEVMITIVIVGILASIAYPSYMSQVRKSRRSDAVQAFSQVQQAQERWRANNTTYSGAIADLGISATTAGGYYTVAVSSTTATGYVATATAVSGKSQTGDTGCTALTATVTNGSAVNAPTSCWSQ